jgi:hypothetical protein
MYDLNMLLILDMRGQGSEVRRDKGQRTGGRSKNQRSGVRGRGQERVR